MTSYIPESDVILSMITVEGIKMEEVILAVKLASVTATSLENEISLMSLFSVKFTSWTFSTT